MNVRQVVVVCGVVEDGSARSCADADEPDTARRLMGETNEAIAGYRFVLWEYGRDWGLIVVLGGVRVLKSLRLPALVQSYVEVQLEFSTWTPYSGLAARCLADPHQTALYFCLHKHWKYPYP